MMLDTDGFQLEIEKGRFVCISDGTISQFCEWKELGPELQQFFSAVNKSLSATLELFMESNTKAAFDNLAEKYGEASTPGERCIM